MKKVLFGLLVAISLSFNNGISDEKAYLKAKKADNVEMYNNFIKKYPNSVHISEITNRVDKILIDACKLLDCPYMFKLYIANNPNSIYIDECKEILQKKLREYEDAVNNNWTKLGLGMSIEEVKKLVPFDCGSEYGSTKRIIETANKTTKWVDFAPNDFCILTFKNDTLQEWTKIDKK